MKERCAHFDNIKAVLITLVVIGHVIEPVASSSCMTSMRLWDLIYLFHMPLFIFVTGLFCKSAYKNGVFRAERVLHFLALCYLLFFLLQFWRIAIGVSSGVGNPFTLGGGSIPWYLMATAFYTMLTPLLSRVKMGFAFAVAIIVSVVSGLFNSTDFLSASRILVFAPFFLAGYYCGPKAIQDVISKLEHRNYLIALRFVAAAVLLVFALAFFSMDPEALTFFRKLFTGRNSYEVMIESSGLNVSLMLCALARTVYYFAVALISACLVLLIPRRKLPFVTHVGERTLQVYFLHPFVFYALNAISFAEKTCSIFPEGAAIAAFLTLSLLITAVLSIPSFPAKCFDRLKGIIRDKCCISED